MRFGIFVVMAGRNAGGPETYEYNLVRSLAALDQHNEYHIFCASRQAAESFQLVQDNVYYHVLWPRNRWISFSTSLPFTLLSSRVALLHSTFTPPPFSPVSDVFTLHDVSMFTHPEFYSPAILWRLKRLVLRGLRQARLILCVSQHTQNLAVETLGIPAERLTTVYHGVQPHFHPVASDQARPTLQKKYGLQSPYILYVGKLMMRKNIGRIVEAFDQFRQAAKSDIKLVLAGARTWTSEEVFATVERCKLKDHVIELGYVSDLDLPALYSCAEMFVFPALDEGFGLPMIEAMACGTPVLTSNDSCLPEIAGGAAVLVNPYSVEDIAAGMYQLFSDSALRQSFQSKGLERAKFFNWQRTAEQTLAAYEKVIAL